MLVKGAKSKNKESRKMQMVQTAVRNGNSSIQNEIRKSATRAALLLENFDELDEAESERALKSVARAARLEVEVAREQVRRLIDEERVERQRITRKRERLALMILLLVVKLEEDDARQRITIVEIDHELDQVDSMGMKC